MPPVPLHVRWEHGARPSAVRPACRRCQPAVGMPHGGRSASGAGVALCGRARRGGRALRQVDCVAVRVQEEALRCGPPALTCAKSARPQDRAPARRAPCCYRPPTDDRRIPHAGLWQRPHAQGRPAVQAACGIRLQVDSNAANPGASSAAFQLQAKAMSGVRGLESTRGTCQSLRTYDPRSDMRQRAACPSPACLHSGQQAACGHKKLGSMP